MAKSQRASRIKKNNTALKSKVFGPAEQARAQRLNDKLLAIAAKPTPAELEQKAKTQDDTAMEIEGEQDATGATKDDSMDVDAGKGAPMSITKQKKMAKSTSSFRKKRRGKERNQIVFGKKNKERAPKKGRH